MNDRPLPYRLFTVADIPFGVFPSAPVGPSLVAATEWSASTSSNDVSEGHKVRSQRFDGRIFEDHILNGTAFSDRESANRAMYEAGLTAYMVYNDTEWAKVADRLLIKPKLGDFVVLDGTIIDTVGEVISDTAFIAGLGEPYEQLATQGDDGRWHLLECGEEIQLVPAPEVGGTVTMKAVGFDLARESFMVTEVLASGEVVLAPRVGRYFLSIRWVEGEWLEDKDEWTDIEF